MDAASKTAEGIKNTATVLDQKPSEYRSRYPRAFYGKEKFYRPYIPSDAEILWQLYHLDLDDLKHISLLSSFDIFPEETQKEDCYILALAYERIVFWSVRKNTLVWDFPTEALTDISIRPNLLQLLVKRPNEIVQVSVLVYYLN